MKCSECGREIADHLKYCKYCGAPVKAAVSYSVDDKIKCKACGKLLKRGIVFCTQCGTPVNGDTASSIKQDIGNGRKSGKRKKGYLGLIVISILTIISILFIGFIAYYFLKKNGIFDKTETTSTASTADTSTEGESSEEGESSAEGESSEEAVDTSDSNEVDELVDEIWGAVRHTQGDIGKGTCDSTIVKNYVNAYTYSNVLVAIIVENSYGTDDYTRSYYYDYDNGELICVEYIAEDLYRFFFNNGELIRWVYSEDAADVKNLEKHDKENTASYLQWEQSVLDESNEFVTLWVNSLQSDVQEDPEEGDNSNPSPKSIPDQYYFYNDHTYGFYNAAVFGLDDYAKVSEFCREQGGHLATINSPEENAFLFGTLRDNYDDTAFFGYSDEAEEGIWQWDFESGDYYYNWTQYGQQQPDNGVNYGTEEDYAEFNYDGKKPASDKVPNDGTWNDAPFRRNTDLFICEWEYVVE